MLRFILWCLITGGVVIGCFFGFGRIAETVDLHYVYKDTIVVISETHIDELEDGLVRSGVEIKHFDYNEPFPAILKYNINSRASLPQFGEGKIDYFNRTFSTIFLGFATAVAVGLGLPDNIRIKISH